ncbi:MAG: hypothetical protein P4L62_01500 [Candidatus Pacebacteria bacterium]|nr:hypothetical protein [Candidatus Paceibacterota bacterium]MDR3583013.1 hypothetical protein [Candidatus Paceibacterota bacterium]
MNLEGKMMGYNKKTVVVAIVAVILAVVIFYAGAEYEKNKMIRLGLCKGGSASVSATGGAKKHKKKVAAPANGMPGTGTTTPAQGTTSGTDTTGSTSGSTTPSQPGSTTTPATGSMPTTPTSATGATN